MFETEGELDELQRLLDASFERAGKQLFSGYDESNRLSARQLSGFQGIRLVAVATVNSKGEPRVAPRSAAFLHGKFYLAANSKSITVQRLTRTPLLGITYFENRLLIMGHGTAVTFREGSSEFEALRPEWTKAFRGGKDALEGIDILIKVDAEHLVAFAAKPHDYPSAWSGRPPVAAKSKAKKT